MTSTVLLARQPIFDDSLNIIAYELLYRDESGAGPSASVDGTRATAEVLLHAYSSVVHKGKVITLPTFINFNTDWLFNDNLPALDPNAIVLEVLEDVVISPPLIEKLQKLSDAGYRLALDDFIYDESWDPAIQLAQIIKLDIQQLSRQDLIEHIQIVQKHNKVLLAEKIETLEEYELCKQLGFKLFQGYFFCRPQLISGNKLNTHTAVIMQLISELDNPNATTHSLKEIISKEPDLVLRLLKIVNSALFAIPREICNISQAIVTLGIDELRKWALLITIKQSGEQNSALIQQVLTRAHMCEVAALDYHINDISSAFMVGMLSGMDAVLNLEMADIMEQLPLSEELTGALLYSKGELGILLADVKNFMHAEWDQIIYKERIHSLAVAQEKSIHWVLETLQELEAD